MWLRALVATTGRVQQVKDVNESVFNLAPDLGAEADRAESKARHGGGNEASLLWVRQY